MKKRIMDVMKTVAIVIGAIVLGSIATYAVQVRTNMTVANWVWMPIILGYVLALKTLASAGINRKRKIVLSAALVAIAVGMLFSGNLFVSKANQYGDGDVHEQHFGN